MNQANDRKKMIEQHLAEVARLQAEETRQLLALQGVGEQELNQLGIQIPGENANAENTWPPKGFYWLFHVIVGMTLGIIGASVSLVANIVGASAFNIEPLKLIRTYLTFPMGADALEISGSGKILFVGCVLYLITGGLYGVAYQVLMKTCFKEAGSVKARFVVATMIGLGLWLVNFYGILSWLQPTLLGGNWIVSDIPILVAILTHLAFAWTLFAVSSIGSGASGGEGSWAAFAPPPPAQQAGDDGTTDSPDLTSGGDLSDAVSDAQSAE